MATFCYGRSAGMLSCNEHSLGKILEKGYIPLTKKDFEQVSAFNPGCKYFDIALDQSRLCSAKNVFSGMSLDALIKYNSTCCCSACNDYSMNKTCLMLFDLGIVKRHLKILGASDEAKELDYFITRVGKDAIKLLFGEV